jgi:tetratricopeptide (TPR) repeat protein
MLTRKEVASIVVLLIGMAASITSFSGFASAQTNSTTTEHANQLAQTGHPQDAIALLRSTLTAQPHNIKARVVLANLYLQNGDTVEAEKQLREGVRIDPQSAEAKLALGAFYIKAGSLAEAEKTLRAAVEQHPKLNESRAQLALVLALQHKYEEAQSNIRLIPPPADSNARMLYYRLLASIDSGLGDLHAAVDATEQALQVAPSDPQLQLMAAMAEAEAGQWQACLRNAGPLFAAHPTVTSGLVLLQAQLATHQDFAPTLNNLRSMELAPEQALALRLQTAKILVSAEQHEAAIEELQAALRLNGKGDEALLYDLAVEQYRAQQSDAALATLNSLQKPTNSAEVENLLGDIEEQKGDSVAAVHSYQNAIALNPHEEQYRLSLGAELLKYHTYEPAALVFRQAAELFPKSTRIYVGLGLTYFLQEKYDESVAAFLQADALEPGSSQILGYIGESQMRRPGRPGTAVVDKICGYANSKNPSPASVTWCAALRFQTAYIGGDQASAPDIIQRLHAAVMLSPSEPVANCSLGHALEWTGQLADARHWLEACVALRPDSAEGHFRLGRVYQRLGLTELAKQEAGRTEKASTAEDRRDAITKTFVYQLQGQPGTSTSAKDHQK